MVVQSIAVLGLGYVGLPVAQACIEAGLSCVGIDQSSQVVEGLAVGKSHIDDIADADVQRMKARGFRAFIDITESEEGRSSARVYVICVPTPLAENNAPDLGAVKLASRAVSAVVQPGDLVVLESTTYPGTTEEVVLPIIEESSLRVGQDVFLAFSPERIDPGNPHYQFANTPKIVGGVTDECSRRAAAFYSQICAEVVVAKGCKEAELAKLLENTYRHVNIALVNEMVQFSSVMGIDLWDSIRCAATKPFGFQAFRPGPGVGGHCIPIDPNYLSHHVRSRLGQPFRFVELAQEINSSMPAYVARRVQDLLNSRKLAVNGSKVLLIGVTYKADIADTRETPAEPLAHELLKLGAEVGYWDPHVAQWAVDGTTLRHTSHVEPANWDCAVILQDHRAFRDAVQDFSLDQVLDTRGVIEGAVRL